MQKPGRNDPCHCGSGNKYKKCCLQIDEKSAALISDKMSASDFIPPLSKDKMIDFSWLKNYDEADLLKALAYLQVHPQNHGKNIRLEVLITEIINRKQFGQIDTDFIKLKADLIKHCVKNMSEDPPEEFLTENISFYDGNYIIFPGIFDNSTEIVQGHLYTISMRRSVLPPAFVREVSSGIMFLLTIHDRLAASLGYARRYFEEAKSDALFIPEVDELTTKKDLFVFHQADINAIADELMIDPNIIHRFTYTRGQRIAFNDPNSNPLLERPFIRFGDAFVLAMPAAQVGCMNEYIIDTAKTHNCLHEFVSLYAEDTSDDITMLFRSMRWTELEPNFPGLQMSDPAVILNEQLFRFDKDKVAFVMTLNEVPIFHLKKVAQAKDRSKMIVQRINHVLKHMRGKAKSERILFLSILNKSASFSPFYLELEEFKDADRQFNLTVQELTNLTAKWRFDHLTLWKYIKALDDSSKEIFIPPQVSELPKFHWYDKNYGSFYHSDREQANYLVFDFAMEGDIKREAKAKMDLISIPFPVDGDFTHVRCRRKEQYYPVYFSEEVKFGYFRYALLKYRCPIWIQSNTSRDRIADIYQNALFFWLHESYGFFRELIDRFGTRPIVIVLMMHPDFRNQQKWHEASDDGLPEFSYELKPKFRAVEINIPIKIIDHLITPDNNGERILMEAVLEGINQLLVELGGDGIGKDERRQMLEEAMPTSRKKMIIMSAATEDPALFPVAMADPRTIQDADVSDILQEQLTWLKNGKKIPDKIATAKEKTDLLNELVGVHFNKLIYLIKKFDALPLLVFLMHRNEALINERASREINFPVEEACYNQFYDVFERYKKTESKLVSASLAVRSLIEFVACEMPTGEKVVNDDDVDMMLAFINEIINYGAASDLIKFGINDPEMGLLPSGRLGIDHDFENKLLDSFKSDIYQQDFDRFNRTFEMNFRRNGESQKSFSDEGNRYYDKVDHVFKTEWGITIWNIAGACDHIANDMVAQNASVGLLTFDQFYKVINTGCSESEARIVLELLTLPKRNGVLNVDKKELHEAYPWRYNRRISYMNKPVIEIIADGETKFLISARHLHAAAQNMVGRFFNGTLKVRKNDFKIQNLLAERNDIKGKQFRNAVVDWLKSNTELTVIDHEVKIKPKGFLQADNDKGDVDIMAIDHHRKIIYAIECKNTIQAKIAYDFYIEIVNYIGLKDGEGMITKHIRRDTWLNENIEQVHQRLSLQGIYTISSFVLTKNILPTKYIKEIEMPLYSFSELRAGKTDILLLKVKQ